MTAAVPVATRPSRSNERPTDRLARTHRAWLEGLRTCVAHADSSDSGIWPRWNAIRYLDTSFRDQFDRERKAMDALGPTVGGDSARQLWAAGELVEALRRQLRQSAGICHQPAEFSAVTTKLLRAAEYWFDAVECAVRPLEWDDLSARTREELAGMGAGALER